MQLVDSLSGDAGVGRKIANAQMSFNCAGVAIALPFLTPLARLLERVLPERSPADVKAEPAATAAPAQ